MSSNPATDTPTTVKTTAAHEGKPAYEWAALALAVVFIAGCLSVGLRAGPFWILPS